MFAALPGVTSQGSITKPKGLILKINPRDVVSIPTDYNASKGRACRYEVIGELGVDPDQAFTVSVQESANDAGTTEAMIKAAVEAGIKAALAARDSVSTDNK